MRGERARKVAGRKRRMEMRRRRIRHRLRDREWEPRDEPMFLGTNVHYDVADRTKALGAGGFGRCTFWPGAAG